MNDHGTTEKYVKRDAVAASDDADKRIEIEPKLMKKRKRRKERQPWSNLNKL